MNASRLASCVLSIVLGCCAVSAMAQVVNTPLVPLAIACHTDSDCDDHVYCNGIERCDGTCHPAPATDLPCMGERQQCSEALTRCEVFRDDRDGDGHNSAATGGDDCDDTDVNTFPGNPEVFDAADHDEDCDADSHGVPAAFGVVGTPGRGQACSGEAMVVLMRGASNGRGGAPDTFTEVSCGPNMGCSGPGVCVAMGPDYVAPPSMGALPHQRQAWNPQPPPSPMPGQASAAPAAMPPLAAPMKMRPVWTAPAPAARPVAKTPVLVPIAGPKVDCPKGEAYSPELKKCIPIPP